jgi:iron complex transport system substrate-binding protein
MKPQRIVALCLVLSAWLGGAFGAVHAMTVTDDRGTRVTFAQAPQRIVSLLPSLTETVCALGQCARLVGVDRHSNFPPEVHALPQVGGGMDPNIESIVALRPGVVLAGSNSRSTERLRALGVPVLVLGPESHADVRRVLETLGQLLQVSDAQRIWREIDAAVAAAARSVQTKSAVRVYYEVNVGPFAAGETSFIGETLSRLGAKNIVPAKLGPFPRLNPEFVVRANPDVIMVGEADSAGLATRPGWGEIRAIKEHRVCIFTSAESDLLVRPGPRMAEAARVMARCLNTKAP